MERTIFPEGDRPILLIASCEAARVGEITDKIAERAVKLADHASTVGCATFVPPFVEGSMSTGRKPPLINGGPLTDRITPVPLPNCSVQNVGVGVWNIRTRLHKFAVKIARFGSVTACSTRPTTSGEVASFKSCSQWSFLGASSKQPKLVASMTCGGVAKAVAKWCRFSPLMRRLPRGRSRWAELGRPLPEQSGSEVQVTGVAHGEYDRWSIGRSSPVRRTVDRASSRLSGNR